MIILNMDKYFNISIKYQFKTFHVNDFTLDYTLLLYKNIF